MTEFVAGLLVGGISMFLIGRRVADLQRGMHDARQAMRRRSAHRKG